MYKMIVLDLDDTLLKNDLTISTRTKIAIEKAQSNGVKVVLASGRPTFGMREYAKELRMDHYGSYILSYNGAIITDCTTNQVVFEQSLSKEITHSLFEISKEHNVYLHTYIKDDIITEKNNQYTKIEEKLTGMKVLEVPNFCNHVQEDVTKVLMLEDPNTLKTLQEKLKPILEDKVTMHITKPYFLEFMDKGIDKASSLEKLIHKLNIRKEEVIAIGDSYNDLGMIKFAGLGVAMDNAPDDIKKESDYITDSNMEDGVAKVIEKFIFKNA